MKLRWAIPNTLLLMLSIGVVSAQNAQKVPAEAETEQVRHWNAQGLLRTINTAEVVEQYTYGHFSPWQILLTHYQESFDNIAAMAFRERRIPKPQLGEPPEIMPGWNLRLNVHTDGQGYDLMFLDMTDKKCAYALSTNETAVIWESKAIYCEVGSQNSASEQN